MSDSLNIAGKSNHSRLLVGTGQYADFAQTHAAIDGRGAEIIIANANIPVLVDAGVGTASDVARDPVLMASAMKKAVEAGRMPKKLHSASLSSPTTGLIAS